MGTTELKLILLFFMGCIPLMFGLLPIKLFGYLTKKGYNSRIINIVISVFSCFAGGVLLGVSLIELFPEARESLEELSKENEFFESYPFVELFVGVGLLFVYFIEEFMTILFGHSHSEVPNMQNKSQNKLQFGLTNSAMTINESEPGDEKRFSSESLNYDLKITMVSDNETMKNDSKKGKPMNGKIHMLGYDSMAERQAKPNNTGNMEVSIVPINYLQECNGVNEPPLFQRTQTTMSSLSFNEFDSQTIVSENPQRNATTSSEAMNGDDRKPIIGAITLVLVLLVHTSLEGFAFGIQNDAIGVSSLFIGIIGHKIVVFFSVGINLAQALPNNPRIIFGLILALASFSPLGGIVGIIVEVIFVCLNSETKGPLQGGISTILMCVSIGTFLYIAFFEILVPERSKPAPKLLQWLGCALGFATMAVVLSFSHHNHHNKEHNHGESVS